MDRSDAFSPYKTDPEGRAIRMKPTLRRARRLLDPRVIALRLIAVTIRRPWLWQRVKALAARFPVLERRLKAGIFLLAEASELTGSAHAVPVEPVCGHARWIHSHLEARQAAQR